MADRVVQILIESSVEGTEEVRQATAATEDLARAEKKAEEASGDAGEAFGKVGENASKLGGAAGLLSPALGEVAMTLADLADLGEVAASTMGELGLGLGASIAVLGALALAVTAAYGAWTYYAAEAEHAQRVQERLNQTLKAGEEAAGRLARLTDQLAVATGSMSNEEATFRASSEAAKAALDAEMDAIAERTGLTRKQVEMAAVAANSSAEAARSLSEEQKSAATQVAIANAEYQASISVLEKTRDATIRTREEAEAKTKADQDQAAAQKALQDRLRETEAALKAGQSAHATSVAAMDEDSKAKAAYMAMLEKLKSAEDAAKTAILSGAEAITAKHAEELRGLEEIYQQTVQAAAADQDRAAANSQYEATLSAVRARQAEELAKFHADESARIEAERHQAIQAELDKANAARQAKIDQIQGGLGALQGGMGGVLNAAGPIGAIINMVIQLVTSIVDEAGNGLIDQIHNMMMEFFNDLSGLGPELADSMIRSVEEGIPALINGISGLIEGLLSPESIQKILVGSLEMLPMMIGGIIELLIVRIPEVAAEFVKTILSPETWIEAGRMLVQGMTENFKGSSLFGQDATFGRTALAVLTGGLSSFVGSFDQTTDYVPKTGLALVHEGEKISRGRTPMGGDTIVQFGGGMVLGTADDIARKIAEQLSGRNIGFGARY